MDRQFARDLIGPEALRRCPALAVRRHRETFRPVAKFTGGTLGGQREHYSGAGDGLVVFILDPDDRFPRNALANLVACAFPFHDHNIQLRRGILGLPALGSEWKNHNKR